MTISPFDPVRFPRYPLNNISPFTYRDGRTFLELIEGLRDYINEDYVAAVNALLGQLNLASEQSIAGLEATFNSQLATFNSAVETLVNDTETEVANAAAAVNSAITDMTTTVNNAVANMNSNAATQIALVNNTMQGYMDDIDAQIAVINEKSGPVGIQYVTLTANKTLTPDPLFPTTHPITYMFTQGGSGKFTVSPGANVVGDIDVNTSPGSRTRVTLYPVGGVWIVESSRSVFDEDLSEVLRRSLMWEALPTRTDITTGALYDAFSSAAISDDGTIVVAYGSQNTHTQPGPGTTVRTSTDGGLTWSTPIVVAAGLGSCGIAAFKNKFAVLVRVNSPTSKGRVFVTSTPTNAASWLPAVDIDTYLPDWMYPNDIAWLDDGTANGLMLVTMYGANGVAVAASTDAGATWSHRSWLSTVAWNAGPNESSIAANARGELVALMRDDSQGGNASTAASMWKVRRSSDWGMTWGASSTVLTATSGQPRVKLMPNGQLISPIRDTSDTSTPQSWAYAYSDDHGTTWTKHAMNGELMLYGGIVPISMTKALMVGSSEISSTSAIIWTRMMRLSPIQPVWESYPSQYLTNDVVLNLGSGSLVAKRVREGKKVTGNIVLTRGADTDQGNGVYHFRLPSVPKQWNSVSGSGTVNGTIPVTVMGLGTDRVGLVGPNGRISNTYPGGNAAGQIIAFGFTYEEI